MITLAEYLWSPRPMQRPVSFAIGLVTSDHLDLDPKGEGVIDGLLGIFEEVVDGKKTDELQFVSLTLCAIATNSSKATARA